MSLSPPFRPRVRESTGTSSKAEAKVIQAKRMAELLAEPAPKVGDQKTWNDAVAAWQRGKERSESDMLSLHKLGQVIGNPHIKDLTGDGLEAALGFCKTVGTYNRYRARVVAVLNGARRRKWIAEVPYIPTRSKTPSEPRWLTKDEWVRLHAALPDHLKGPAVLAINTGLRQANVFGLKWENVDEEGRLLRVTPDAAKARQGLGIPLNDEALKAIQAQAGKHPEFVFTYRGRPMAKPKEGFAQALRSAGIEGFRWHDFRHTWATWHVHAGTPVDVLMKLGGWADIRMALRYSHHSAQHLAKYAGNVTNDVSRE